MRFHRLDKKNFWFIRCILFEAFYNPGNDIGFVLASEGDCCFAIEMINNRVIKEIKEKDYIVDHGSNTISILVNRKKETL